MTVYLMGLITGLLIRAIIKSIVMAVRISTSERGDTK
jgi:hypothetical protein